MNSLTHRLDESIDHPLYEMEMLLGAPKEMARHARGSVVMNALVESFVVHARCLDEFFSKGRDQTKRNMRAIDFDPQWHPVSPHPKIEKINREVSHIGWTRKRPGTIGEPWTFTDVILPLASPALLFLDRVSRRPDLTEFEKNGVKNGERIKLLTQEFSRHVESARFVKQLESQPYLASSSSPVAVTISSAFPVHDLATGST